ncbi:hypothetical protein D3C81_1554470 [compost metagenome]
MTPSITILLTRISSMVPPRPRRDFMRIPRSVSLNTQLLIVTLRISPLISLPSTTAPCPWTIVQPMIEIFSQGIRSAVSSVPALIAMQSSPTSILQLLIRTPEQDSGLIPSVFGESAGFRIEILSMVTLLHRIGLTVQLGEFSSVTSLIVTRWQLFRPISVGRGYSSSSG